MTDTEVGAAPAGIDLDDLGALCPGLPEESAGPLALRARTALERRHAPGVSLGATVRGVAVHEELRWRRLPAAVARTQDDLRATEEGAVALALALSARWCGWRVVRCLQSRLGEGADWLMLDTSRRRVLLEVGGTDRGSLQSLLGAKLRQAKRSIFARHGLPAACVVRFADPQAVLVTNDDPR